MIGETIFWVSQSAFPVECQLLKAVITKAVCEVDLNSLLQISLSCPGCGLLMELPGSE